MQEEKPRRRYILEEEHFGFGGLQKAQLLLPPQTGTQTGRQLFFFFSLPLTPKTFVY